MLAGGKATPPATGGLGLLERESELAAIDAMLEAAQSGFGRTLYLNGEPGSGKTELLAHARRRAAQHGLETHFARGGELAHDAEGEFAFGVVRQLFEPTVSRASPQMQGELFPGAAGIARGLLWPEAGALGSAPCAGALMHGLYWLTTNLADRAPRLIAVDDLHWSDEASVHFLSYLARRVEGIAVAVLLAARPQRTRR